MKHHACRLAALVLISIVSLASAAEKAKPKPRKPAAPAKPAKPTPPKFTNICKFANQVTQATLSNGLTVIVQENHVAPVATVRCYVNNTGSAYEGKYLGAGLSHVLEHVVSGGSTKKRTEKEIEKIVDRFGGATNAFTSTHLTGYYIDCPAKDVMTTIDLVADSMQHIIFEPSEFARELKVVRREMADGENSRQRVQWKMLKETLYTVHPIRYPVIGYLDVLNRTSNETIMEFYRKRYVPNNQVFVVVGDVKTREILDGVAKAFTGTTRGYETFVPMPEEPEQLTPREAVREMDGKTYDLVLAWPTAELSSPDLFPLDVAAYILTEGDSSRMARRLKYDEQLVLSIDSTSYTPHFAKGVFAIMANCTPQTWQKASDEIESDVYRLRDKLVSPTELAKAKKQKASELVFQQQTVQETAESLGRNFLSTDDPLFDQKYVEGIQNVTAEQVRDVARRYFVANRLNRVIIAPPGGAPKEASEQGGGGVDAIRAVKLRNGLRVLVKRHSHLPMVNIQAYVLGGCLVDTPETAGRSALVGAMLDKGTARHSGKEIAEYFDSIGGKFGMSAGRFTVYGNATVLKDDFPKAMELFAECYLEPTFPDEEFKKVQALALGAIARRAASAHAEILELFYDNLPPTTPYHVLQGGKEETVKRLTAKDLRAYHKKYFVPENMVLTVFGDIDPDRALGLIRKTFGRLKSDPKHKPIDFDRANAIPKSIVRHKKTGKKTGMVMMGYAIPSIRDKKDHAALVILDAVMSGYSFPGGWLHNELRGEGLVYGVHAFQVTGPSPGYFAILAQTDPATVGEVVERIKKNVARAKAGKIPSEQFNTAVQMVLSLHAQDNTTIGKQAGQAALDDLYGLGYAYDKTFDERIKGVTPEDVVRVAKTYLNNYVLVTSSSRDE